MHRKPRFVLTLPWAVIIAAVILAAAVAANGYGW